MNRGDPYVLFGYFIVAIVLIFSLVGPTGIAWLVAFSIPWFLLGMWVNEKVDSS